LVTAAGVLRADPARDERIRQDLAYAVNQITSRHPNPYTKISRDAFDQRRQSLSDSIPALPDLEAYLRIKALIASIGDAHTGLNLDDNFYRTFGLRHFPVRTTLYDDGLFVAGTDAAHSVYLGQRVVSINGRTPEALLEGVRGYLSFDNENWLRQQFGSMLRSPQLLHGLGLASDPDRSEWIVEDLGGRRETLPLEGLETPPAGASINDPVIGYLSPTYSDLQLAYWYRYYPEQNLLFFKYNACRERPDLPFADFAADLFRELDAHPVDHLVVDLRDNGGGNSEVWRPFLNGLQGRYSRLRENPRFGLYGLISRLTFSSGMLAAQELKRFAGALLVGEDTGGNPDSFGDIVNYQLPNSGLAGGVSTKHFQPFVPGIEGPAVKADVRAYRDSGDVFARFDPILFRVFSLRDFPVSSMIEDRSSPVVSAASFRPGSPQAPGSLTTVFADFGDLETAVAGRVPLPSALEGVELRVGGRVAPLLLISRNQINFQQPSAELAAEEAVEVRRAGAAVWTGSEAVAAAAPAIFVSDPLNIRRPGAVLNEDGSLNSSERRAARGSVLQIFATGYPELNAPLAAGNAPPSGTLLSTRETPTVWIGQWSMQVFFSGASPEFPGLWQVNARIPDEQAIGKLMPLVILSKGRMSNAVSVWVEAGDGGP
jgi:uncharacterized protein (TIGR03437 family)